MLQGGLPQRELTIFKEQANHHKPLLGTALVRQKDQRTENQGMD